MFAKQMKCCDSDTWYLVMHDFQPYLFLRQNFPLFIGKIIIPFHSDSLLPMRKKYARMFQNEAIPSRSSCPSPKNPPVQLDMSQLCLAFFPHTFSFSFADPMVLHSTHLGLTKRTNKSSRSLLLRVECLPSLFFGSPRDNRCTCFFLV